MIRIMYKYIGPKSLPNLEMEVNELAKAGYICDGELIEVRNSESFNSLHIQRMKKEVPASYYHLQDDSSIIRVGKHAGKTVAYILSAYPQYLDDIRASNVLGLTFSDTLSEQIESMAYAYRENCANERAVPPLLMNINKTL